MSFAVAKSKGDSSPKSAVALPCCDPLGLGADSRESVM